MSRPLVITGCECSGKEAPIERGDDGLTCRKCGADEAALIAYEDGRAWHHDALAILRAVSYQDLAAEFDRRTSDDLGLSAQICPRCSSAATEVFGQFSRNQGRFVCNGCSLILPQGRYEHELERFEQQRWRARQSALEMKEFARAVR